MVKLDTLKEQLKVAEEDFEAAKSVVYRCDGAIQILKHLIKEAEEESEVKTLEGEVLSPPPPKGRKQKVLKNGDSY